MRAAEELLLEGRSLDAVREAEAALAFYRSVGASFYIDRIEGWFSQRASA